MKVPKRLLFQILLMLTVSLTTTRVCLGDNILYVTLERHPTAMDHGVAEELKDIVDDYFKSSYQNQAGCYFEWNNDWFFKSEASRDDYLRGRQIKYLVEGVIKKEGVLIEIKLSVKNRDQVLYQPYLMKKIQVDADFRKDEVLSWVENVVKELGYLQRESVLRESIQVTKINWDDVQNLNFPLRMALTQFDQKVRDNINSKLSKSYYLFPVDFKADKVHQVTTKAYSESNPETTMVLFLIRKKDDNMSYSHPREFQAEDYEVMVGEFVFDLDDLMKNL